MYVLSKWPKQFPELENLKYLIFEQSWHCYKCRISGGYQQLTHLLCHTYHYHRTGAFYKRFKERDGKQEFNSSRVCQVLKVFDT